MVSDGTVALARQGPIEQACAVWTPMLPFRFSVILPGWMDGPCKPQVDSESEKKFDLVHFALSQEARHMQEMSKLRFQ